MDENELIKHSGLTTIKHLLHENTSKEHIKETQEYFAKNLKSIKKITLKSKLLLFFVLLIIFFDIFVLSLFIYVRIFNVKAVIYFVSLMLVTGYFVIKYMAYKKELKKQIYITYMYLLSLDAQDCNLLVKNLDDNIFTKRFKSSIDKNKLHYPIHRI